LGIGKPFSSVQATESQKKALLKTNEISPAPGFSRSPKRNYERIYHEQKEAERKPAERAGET